MRVRKHGAMWCQRPKDELGCVAGPGWVALHRQQERQALVVSIGLYLVLMIVEQKANGKRLSRRTQRRVLLRRDETDGWRASHVRTTRRARIRPRHIYCVGRAMRSADFRALFGRASGRRSDARPKRENLLVSDYSFGKKCQHGTCRSDPGQHKMSRERDGGWRGGKVMFFTVWRTS